MIQERASSLENEIKLAIADAATGQLLLARHGFEVTRPRVFERNLVFDTPLHQLRSAGKVLRLRKAGARSTVTFKGPAAPGKHKSREEREVEVGGFEEFQIILERLGFAPAFTYEKYRTEYSRAAGSSTGIVMLDETPIGAYLELEGPPAWIDLTATALGYREADYITQSYTSLYRNSREKPAGGMCFPER